jgi:hypothetical protein
VDAELASPKSLDPWQATFMKIDVPNFATKQEKSSFWRDQCIALFKHGMLEVAKAEFQVIVHCPPRTCTLVPKNHGMPMQFYQMVAFREA